MAEGRRRREGRKADAQKPEKRVPAHGGGALYTGGVPGNRGGQPGRSGRKSEEWREEMAELARDPRARATLRRILRGKLGHEAFLKAFRYVTEQAHGKAVQPVQLGSDPDAPAIIRIVEE